MRARATAVVATVVAMAAALPALAQSATGAPAPLSADASSPRIESAHGSGAFGRWIVDRFGLPAYRYDIDQQTDPIAQSGKIGVGTSATHVVGNDSMTAAAFNDGHVQFWSELRELQWLNKAEPAQLQYGGGFGYLNVGGKVLSTFYPDRPAGATTERVFGTGYYRKTVESDGLRVVQTVYAPFGDEHVLLDDVVIRNDTDHAIEGSWFEYQGVNPIYAPVDAIGVFRRSGLDAPTWDAARRTLAVAEDPGSGNDRPLTIFAAPLRGPADGFETDANAFFGDGSRAVPAAVAADHPSGSIAPPVAVGQRGRTMLGLRSPIQLEPGESVTLRYAFGAAQPRDVAPTVRKLREQAQPLQESAARWKRYLPKADLGERYAWVARELQWNGYLHRAASTYQESCGHHTISEGGAYQFVVGVNLAFRDFVQYIEPLIYGDPGLARSNLLYAIGLQPKDLDNAVPAAVTSLCERFMIKRGEEYVSIDSDVWLLQLAAEYGLATRDLAFFRRPVPFYRSVEVASVWEHLKLAFEHVESHVGPHGGYEQLSDQDWDQSDPTLTETMFVAAVAAYTYPRVADLADRLGDHRFAAAVRRANQRARKAVESVWSPRGWYAGWFRNGDTPVGKDTVYLQPQPWAILAGIPTARQSRRIVANIRRYLTGIGAPPELGGPSKIGSAQVAAASDPGATELCPPTVVFKNAFASCTFGGSWYTLNGRLTQALAALDGVVPRAKDYAWDEYLRSTLASHAEAFPDRWDGITSVDDVCNAFYDKDPGGCGQESLFPKGMALTGWQGNITWQANVMVTGLQHLAGIRAVADGYEFAPHLPIDRFTLRLPRVGFAAGPKHMRGYVTPVAGGRLAIRVKLPDAAWGRAVVAWADGRRVAVKRRGAWVRLELNAVAGEPLDWAIGWPTRRSEAV